MTTKPAPPLIAIMGPTAVGKTSLSLELCARFRGEIVGADSRQVYRMMDIGTAKPTADELARAPHHLVSIRNPDQVLSVAEYQQLAYATIDDIHTRAAVPILVGGSALYLRSVIEGLRIPNVPPNPALRDELEADLATYGVETLFQRLQQMDPATAAVIDARNPRRVLRALEIFLVTGKPKVELEGADPPPYRILQIGLDRERAILYDRVDRRVEQMIADGLVEETRRLLAAGYTAALPSLTSLGYREIIAYINGEMDLDASVERIQIETHRFVRHQYTWFRRMKHIHWFDMDQVEADEIITLASSFLST